MNYRSSLVLLTVVCFINEFALGQKVAGAGATFPAPLYHEWFDAFRRERPDAILTYDAVGTGEGRRRVLAGELDFAGSDWPLEEPELAKAEIALLQLPTAIGAVVPAYHLNGLSRTLRLSPEALAGIFGGKIRRWNHPMIQRDNVGVALPSDEIRIVCRADASGTTMVWSRFLRAADAGWKRGAGFLVSWPAGKLEAQGNDGVAQTVEKTDNSIGYVEYIFAIQHHLDYAEVKNKSGRFIHADVESIRAAVPASVPLDKPLDLALSVMNSDSPRAYPVVSFTWLLIPRRMADEEIKSTLVAFLYWMLDKGQLITEGTGFVSLPENLIQSERKSLRNLDGPVLSSLAAH